MNILLLGSGGREHALAWKISQSKTCEKLFIAPGNAGTHQSGTNVALKLDDFDSIGTFVTQNNVGMVVVGPEDPLVNGIRDYFESTPQLSKIPVIGPGKAGAQLEGSKAFSKAFMRRHGIPTAAYASFTSENIEDGYAFLETLTPPYVLKADGLAAGKGVLILENLSEARSELKAMLLDSKFGHASRTVVIESFLQGIEVSVFVLTDGRHYLLLPEAKDYKRIGEDDSGLNTGGMGAVSPVPFCTDSFLEKVKKRILEPTLSGLQHEGIGYKGFLFIGLMRVNGDPYVIEYNVRMGDPETEVVIPRIENDLVELFVSVAEGTLDQHELKTDPRTAVTTVLVSAGYPGSYEKGKQISGVEPGADTLVFHAGTATSEAGVVTSGGRVLAVTAFGHSIQEAADRSRVTADAVHFEGKYYRKDIGKDLIRLEGAAPTRNV